MGGLHSITHSILHSAKATIIAALHTIGALHQDVEQTLAWLLSLDHTQLVPLAKIIDFRDWPKPHSTPMKKGGNELKFFSPGQTISPQNTNRKILREKLVSAIESSLSENWPSSVKILCETLQQLIAAEKGEKIMENSCHQNLIVFKKH